MTMNNALLKGIALLLSFLMIPWTAFAGTAEETAADTPAETGTHTVECRSYPYFRTFDDEDVVESTMNLYFIDGWDIPYAALSEYMPFFAGLMKDYDDWEGLTFGIEYIREENAASDSYWVSREDNNTAMIVLPGVDQIWFDSYNLFMARPGVESLVAALDLPEPEETDFVAMLYEAIAAAEEMAARGEEIPENFYEDYFAIADPARDRGFFLNVGGSYNRHGDGLYLDFAAYGIDLYSIDGECYVPFQTLNDLFMNQQYLQFIFNGQTVLGAAYGCELLERAFEAEPEEMSVLFSLYNYNELLFLLDTFYGLKPEHGIEDFTDMIAHNRSLISGFMNGTAAEFDNALMLLLGYYLDDLHSGFNRGSWRVGGGEDAELDEAMKALKAMGYSNSAYFSETFRHTVPRSAAFPDGIPGYEEIGDTAFVTFDGFRCTAVEDSYSEYYDLGLPKTLEECGDDTIRLIQYANEQIRREDSPVRSVVLDLSNNSGGSVAAAVAVMCWYLGEASFALRDTMTGALSIMHYGCDLNLDEISSDSGGDSLAGLGLNLYCIISPLSFSCGNLVPAFFKESHRVTLIGQRSGGGSCVVLPCSSASGALFQISGTKQIALVRNGSFYNVDQGVEPDIPLTRIESFYDREGLVEMIHAAR